MMKRTLLASLLATTGIVLASGAGAQTLAALTGDNMIVIVDAAAKTAGKSWQVSGISERCWASTCGRPTACSMV